MAILPLFETLPGERLGRQVAALVIGILGFALAAAPLSSSVRAEAEEESVSIAVAANFTAAAQEIAAAFTGETGYEAVLSFGSTGKLYAQIAHGAPFQVFMAADAARPARAEAEGLAVAGSRFTYALGRIVLYSTIPDLVAEGGEVLKTDRFNRLALANPKTAPYGAAALQALEALSVLDSVQSRLVRGDSIAQTYQFVATGNAELGFVALSQVIGTEEGSRWIVPGDLYSPLRQDAVLLQAGADSAAAKAWMAFLHGKTAHAIIGRYGYERGK